MKTKIIFINRILYRFLISYILVLILPNIIGIYSYYQALQIIEADIKTSSLNMLQQTVGITDRYLQEVGSTVSQISIQSNINDLMTYGNENRYNNYEMSGILDDISQFVTVNDLIKTFFITL